MADQHHPMARTERLIVDSVGDEVLVYDLDSDRAHCLDAAAAAIWRSCDGGSGVAELAGRLGVSEEVVRLALERLAAADLLVESVGAPDTHSRRTVLRRGLVAGAAGIAAVPVVKTIVAPPPAAAGSAACLGAGAGCAATPTACCPPLVCCTGDAQPTCKQPVNCAD